MSSKDTAKMNATTFNASVSIAPANERGSSYTAIVTFRHGGAPSRKQLATAYRFAATFEECASEQWCCRTEVDDSTHGFAVEIPDISPRELDVVRNLLERMTNEIADLTHEW